MDDELHRGIYEVIWWFQNTYLSKLHPKAIFTLVISPSFLEPHRISLLLDTFKKKIELHVYKMIKIYFELHGTKWCVKTIFWTTRIRITYAYVNRLVEEVKQKCGGVRLENDDVYMNTEFEDFTSLVVRRGRGIEDKEPFTFDAVSSVWNNCFNLWIAITQEGPFKM